MWLFDWQVRILAPAPDLFGQFRQNGKTDKHCKKKLSPLAPPPPPLPWPSLAEFIFTCAHALARSHTHTQLGQLHLALLAASNQVQGRVHAQRGGSGQSGGAVVDNDDDGARLRFPLQLQSVWPAAISWPSSQVKSSRVESSLDAFSCFNQLKTDGR